MKKIKKIKILDAENINNDIVPILNQLECLIIDNYKNNIKEELLYSILNQSKQLEKYIVINSIKPISKMNLEIKDLQSRVNSFVFIGIDLPTDELLKVIISKSFSEKQII